MSTFPIDHAPVQATCRWRKCQRPFHTRFLDQKYCTKQCKDSAAKARARERGHAARLGLPLEDTRANTADQARSVLEAIQSPAQAAVDEAIAKARAEGKSPAEIYEAGQQALHSFRPVESAGDEALRAFREFVAGRNGGEE